MDAHLRSSLRRAADLIPGSLLAYDLYWRARTAADIRRAAEPHPDILDIFRRGDEPTLERVTSQVCTGRQMVSSAYRRWCRAMRSPPRFHRKWWEFVYIVEAVRQAGLLAPGKRALGFGCGLEPIPALLARAGVTVLATDLASAKAHEKGWVEQLQNSGSLDRLARHSERIMPQPRFLERASFRSVDMNAIPAGLTGFDVVWSACALEHLGSLRHGIEFIKQSARCLAPGGIAVHTTEFNLSSNDDTLEDPNCSIYRLRDIERLQDELAADGFQMAPLNVNCGSMGVDEYVDLPPYRSSPSLKIRLGQYVTTSLGIIVRRP